MEKMLSDVTGTMVYNPCCEDTTPNMAADQWLIDKSQEEGSGPQFGCLQ